MISTCLHHAVDIERRFSPPQWPAELEKVPAECREECETYLRQQAQRIRVIRSMKEQRGQ